MIILLHTQVTQRYTWGKTKKTIRQTKACLSVWLKHTHVFFLRYPLNNFVFKFHFTIILILSIIIKYISNGTDNKYFLLQNLIKKRGRLNKRNINYFEHKKHLQFLWLNNRSICIGLITWPGSTWLLSLQTIDKFR